MMYIDVDLLQWLIKKSFATCANKYAGSCIENENMTKFKRRKVVFIDNIWVVCLADMQLISKFNKELLFLLSVIDIYSKYAWVIPLKYKKRIIITNAFQKILKESNRKSNKIWVDKGSEFYNRSMKSWLEKNDIEMYSMHNEGKSVIAGRFIRTLKNKTYEYMTSLCICVY